MTPERAQMYDNAFWMVNRLTDECGKDTLDPIAIGVVVESLGYLLGALQRGEPRRSSRRAKWEVSADAAA